MVPYLVHGLTRSYFTRKVTGYLDYTDRPWRLEPMPPNDHPAATAAGWTGGMPVVVAPDGALLWDSTTIIEHLDLATAPDRGVLPEDPTLRFLAFLLDDQSELYERAKLLQEEIASRVAEDTNRNLYVLSVLTAVLMPMTLVTGIFGMNTGGLPFATGDHAFWWVMLLVLAAGVGTAALLFFKRLL